MKPFFSVILNTARSGYSMLGLPDIHHFEYTIQALTRQSFRHPIEFIISDYIWATRKFDWNKINTNKFPIYHVPITHSIFKDKGYVAISACKNNGIAYSEGKYLIFLDDCCSFSSDFLFQIFNIVNKQRTFPNPLHIKQMGPSDYVDANGNPIRDCRYQLLDHAKTDMLVDCFHLYGYETCSMDAALELNGFDEFYDGSRQLEDIDFGERLKKAGYHISLHRNLFVAEQEHTIIAPQSNDLSPWHISNKEDEISFKPNLKCNGPVLHMKFSMKTGRDFIEANRRGLTDSEKERMNPCYLKKELCQASNLPCNWPNNHMILKDSGLYYTNPPVFDLKELRNQKLSAKHNHKVK